MSADEPSHPTERRDSRNSPREREAPSAREPPTALKIGFGVLAVFVLLYSVLIATRPLLGVSFVVWLVGLYLLWRFFHLATRFVRAVERIADALDESDGETAGSSSRADSGPK